MDQVKFFNDCLPQILLGPFLNTLSQILYYPHIIFNFNSPHRGLSLHKCKKKNCPHKIFANFQVKPPIIMGGQKPWFLFLCFCETYRFQNLWHHHINWYIGQISVSMTNISNMFLAQCWRLETVPGTFLTLLKW